MGKTEDRITHLVDDFCDNNFAEDDIRQWCRSKGLPNSVCRAFYESEIGSFVLPIQLGGSECTFYERTLILRRLMQRAGATLPFLPDMLSLALLSSMRELSQQEIAEDFLSRNGRVSFSQAFTEDNAGSDAAAVSTTVSADFDGLFLTGTKSFVSNGQFAPSTLVLARDPVCGRLDANLALWLVPISEPGISTFPLNTIGQEMLAPAIITFDQVRLQPDWQIQTEGHLDLMLKRQYELGRILVCASSLGLARAAMDDALAYARSHKIKGQILGSLPQVQEKLTDMEIKLRAAEKFLDDASRAIDANSQQVHLNCALMKRYVPSATVEVASDALQLFGGIGYTERARVGRIWQDCRGNQIAQGTDEVMVRIAAKFLCSKGNLKS